MDILVEDEYFWILILVESLDVLYFLDLGEDLLDSKGDDWEILDFVVWFGILLVRFEVGF